MTVRQCTHRASTTGVRCGHQVDDLTPACAAAHPNPHFSSRACPMTSPPVPRGTASSAAAVSDIDMLLGGSEPSERDRHVAAVGEVYGQLHRAHPEVRLGLSAASWGGLVLDLIVVPKERRGSGEGSALLGELCAEADRRGWALSLNISTDFGGSRGGLERLYRRFGFVPNRGRRARYEISEGWVREPR